MKNNKSKKCSVKDPDRKVITIKEIIEANEAIIKIEKKDFPFIFSYYVSGLKNSLRDYVSNFDKSRDDIFKKYGETIKSKDGVERIEISKEKNKIEASREINLLLSQEVLFEFEFLNFKSMLMQTKEQFHVEPDVMYKIGRICNIF